MKKNYLYLNRSLRDHEMWTEEPFTRGQAWVDLLMMAAYKDQYARINGRKIDLKPGQLCWSKVKLASRWKWSRGKVIRFLNELKTEQMIVHQNFDVTTLITILNWADYQLVGTPDETPDGTPDSTPNRTPDGTPNSTGRNNTQKIKKGEEGEELDLTPRTPPKIDLKNTDPIHWIQGKFKIFKPKDHDEKAESLAEWAELLEKFGVEQCDQAYAELDADPDVKWIYASTVYRHIQSQGPSAGSSDDLLRKLNKEMGYDD